MRRSGRGRRERERKRRGKDEEGGRKWESKEKETGGSRGEGERRVWERTDQGTGSIEGGRGNFREIGEKDERVEMEGENK